MSALDSPVSITLLLGSPNRQGHSVAVADVVLSAAGDRCRVERHDALPENQPALAALERSDAVLFAAPTYRETYPGTLKSFLDSLPRGGRGEGTAPLAGKPVGIILTGATAHHFLALNSVHGLLTGGFAAFVVPVSIYAHHAHFGPDSTVTDPELRARAELLGRTLVTTARLLRGCPELRALRPQI